MKKVIFDYNAFEDFNEWLKIDKKIHKKIIDLIKEIQRNSFVGLGKPEPLKNDLSGYWSRRITEEHRLVYKVNDNEIIIISCKYHYDK
ncbi:MAG: toxin YoeB [Spirochaetes bacterium GWC1_27_15]|nr:MAG: toxin YoeB [Spirochaetes bacterium GWB1_27_13]OHD27898.1 MAG: toxin YoeB [Spirochaetes bacterium GWC1_27_15]